MRATHLLAVLIGLAAAASTARADCARRAWVGTADASNVPHRGSLYVHDEMLTWTDEPALRIAWADPTRAGTTTITRVGDRVARVDYEGPPGAALTLSLPYSATDPSTYYLTDAWQPPRATPRALQYWHERSAWTCSNTDSLMIQLDQPTAALRVRWTHGGETVERIEAVHAEATKAVLELGKIDCGGTTIPPHELAAGGHLELVAIRFDGSEAVVRGLPSRISTADLLTRADGLGGAFTLVRFPPEASPPSPPSHRAAASPPTERGLIGLALLGIALVLLGFRVRVHTAP